MCSLGNIGRSQGWVSKQFAHNHRSINGFTFFCHNHRSMFFFFSWVILETVSHMEHVMWETYKSYIIIYIYIYQTYTAEMETSAFFSLEQSEAITSLIEKFAYHDSAVRCTELHQDNLSWWFECAASFDLHLKKALIFTSKKLWSSLQRSFDLHSFAS